MKRLVNKPLRARFYNYVEKTDGCWIWRGPQRERGYGCLYVEGKNIQAHRVSWMVHRGLIPSGLYVCHRCDNPSCVNPEHLFIGTCADNVRDCHSKGRAARGNGFKAGERHHNAKLTREKAGEIRRRRLAGEVRHTIARDFGVSLTTVTQIASSQRWK